MPIANINSNTVVVQTAAQWAVDATVYTNKQILVTSDAYWGSTDQRKFKIADGTQTWANLDYPPFETSANTLSEVLTAGASTGGLNIESPNAENAVICNNTLAALSFSNSGTGESSTVAARTDFVQIDYTGITNAGLVNIDDTSTQAQHDSLIELNSPNVNLPQETASLILSTDASKNIKGLSTSTYPSLTELSYVKGVTSSIQTQLDSKKGFVMQGASNSTNPSDGSVSCFADANVGILSAYSTSVRFYVPSIGNMTLESVDVFVRVSGTLGSSETGSFYLVKNGSTDILITSSMVWNASEGVFSATGLSTSFTSGDWFNFKVNNPTWATNPVTVSYTVTCYFK